MRFWNALRGYVFIPSGETVRGAEYAIAIAVATVAVNLDWTQFTEWHTYAIALAVVGVVAFWAFVKSQLFK